MRRLLLFAVALLLCQPAWAGNRVALVIGNSTYKNAALLLNPVNDAAIVAATLKNAGFDVVETRLDLRWQTCGVRCAISLTRFATQM